MNETVYLPPEVCGCLSVAQRHLRSADTPLPYYGRHLAKVRRKKHEEKVQKLVARAAKLMKLRGVPCP